MAETDNAYTLVSTSRHPMELVYADYANDMKALANAARVEAANTGKIAYRGYCQKHTPSMHRGGLQNFSGGIFAETI